MPAFRSKLYYLSDWLHQRFRFQFQNAGATALQSPLMSCTKFDLTKLAELALVAQHFSQGTLSFEGLLLVTHPSESRIFLFEFHPVIQIDLVVERAENIGNGGLFLRNR